jgi:hypothetical protein
VSVGSSLAGDPDSRPRTAAEAALGWRSACAAAGNVPTEAPPEGTLADEDGETPVLSRRPR